MLNYKAFEFCNLNRCFVFKAPPPAKFFEFITQKEAFSRPSSPFYYASFSFPLLIYSLNLHIYFFFPPRHSINAKLYGKRKYFRFIFSAFMLSIFILFLVYFFVWFFRKKTGGGKGWSNIITFQYQKITAFNK